ncbi:GNAT family N-acetyltransferase [Rheinheimera maricola]|uniref:GNAT family N-acetyltransferase n=1 Tax=Rheinheimera maricola TaxID=2793282 RepID=A0ABS7X871_9GAMM|nr:GNAT family N-acetyltransferase [Rheinheimera maricola]MBZ9611734.1 GNAT family N-acetyltransferase [Rheinheimera maricola]
MSKNRQHTVKIYPVEYTLPEELQKWLNKNTAHTIFASFEWFVELSKFKKLYGCNKDTEFFWLFIFESDVLCLAAPLEKCDKKLRIISNFYTPFTELFFDNTVLTAEQAWTLLLTQLNVACKNWRSLEIAPLISEQFKAISDVSGATAVSLFKYPLSVNYCTDYPDFATYWKSRSSRLKNTYKRRLNTLSKQNFSIDVYAKVTDEIKQEYWQIYQQSWKIQEPSTDFINWLMQWADGKQQFRLGLLRINGIPAAFQLWLLDGATAYIFKLAQDKQFDTFSPGTILTKYMIEQLSESDAIRFIDFLLGDDAFKALWMDNKKNIIGVEIINQITVTGKLLISMYKLRDFIKKTTGIIFSRNKVVEHHSRVDDE